MKTHTSVPTVVITDLSNRISYVQWFVYGLMLLNRSRRIRLKFRVPFYQRLLLMRSMSLPLRILRKLTRKFLDKPGLKTESYMRGYIDGQDRRRSFCLDSADSPNMLYGKLLREVDCYFKLQCPKDMDPKGFRLGNSYLPYFDVEFENTSDNGKLRGKRKSCPEAFEFQHKIKPLMIAVRSMGNFCSFEELDSAYRNLLISRSVKQEAKAMCYFGNAKGPVPTRSIEEPDYDWEADIMGFYGDRLHHPNEKRARVAEILSSFGEGYDARIINQGNSDNAAETERHDLVIPLKDFSAFVARFQYNINVSGYRMSIPARFIDSFICGTAVATDNLAVKWYHPFGREVYEFGEMGYLPDEEVDYSAIKTNLAALPQVDKQEVISNYEKYWSPEAVATHLVETVLKS